MWDEDDEFLDENEEKRLDEEEDVNYEAAKDLEDSRWQGIVATCRR